MVENTPKPVTRKPTWATGVLLPALAGVPFGSFFGISASMYAFGGWQALCGVAVAASCSETRLIPRSSMRDTTRGSLMGRNRLV